MNMLRHTKTLGVVEVDSTVWKKLTDTEKKWIEAICDERLEKYYQRIGNARQN
jgi:putative methionine-R-sulfoxide reductase with GAF domain